MSIVLLPSMQRFENTLLTPQMTTEASLAPPARHLGSELLRVALTRFYLSPLTVLMVAVVFSHFAVYQINAYGSALFGEYVKFFIVAGSPALLLADSWRNGVQVRMGIWSVCFLALATWSVQFVSPTESSAQALYQLTAALIFLHVCLALFSLPTLNRLGVDTLAICVPVMGALNVAEVIRPELFILSQLKGRSAGFYVNPNVSAMVITAGMLIALRAVPVKFRLWYIAAVFCGVLVTWSRMGILGFVAAFIYLTLVGTVRIGGLKKLSSVFLLVAGLLLAAAANSAVATIAPDLIASPDVAVRRDQVMSGTISDVLRTDLMLDNIKLYTDQPLTGVGFFTTRNELVVHGPHNMYVAMAAELGIAGAILYIAWFLVMWRRGQDGFAHCAIVYLVFVSFFNHNMFDYQSIFMVVALIVVRPTRTAQVARQATPMRGRGFPPEPMLLRD